MPPPNPQLDQFTANAPASCAWLIADKSRRADLLGAIAAALEARRQDILNTTRDETALTVEELTPEFARVTGTLRMFAGIARDGSWARAAIDAPRASATDAIGPNHDVRCMLVPVGPIAVFGASNFPLAYGVCGGDTASALAAGCPVVVKEHPAHPRTGRLIHNIAKAAIAGHGAPPDLLGYVPNEDPKDLSIAQAIVQHPAIKAIGFTGSQGAGLAIEQLARERSFHIPVFAEMGSNNIVVISAAAAQARAHDIADQLASSILQRSGQQCTRPGTIIIEPGEAGTRLIEHLAQRIQSSPGRDMLAPWIKRSYEHRLMQVGACPGVRTAARGKVQPGPRGSHAALFAIDNHQGDARAAFNQDALREEIFGPAAVVAQLPFGMLSDLHLPGSLTYSIYCEPAEHSTNPALRQAVDAATRSAGRVSFNGVPTGVRVCASMVHGGPFPATNRPDTTAVGPRAIERWCRPVCYQNCPDDLLPPELQATNPLHIFRQLDGHPKR